MMSSGRRLYARVIAFGIVAAGMLLIVSAVPAADPDLEAGLAYVRAGDPVLAERHLARYRVREADPRLGRELDLAIAQLRDLSAQDTPERVAQQLQRVEVRVRQVLHWRYRNFPPFP